MPTSDAVLDLRGLFCPAPVLRAKTALLSLPLGGALVLECTDPLTVVDIPVFARQSGNELIEQHQDGELYIFTLIRRR